MTGPTSFIFGKLYTSSTDIDIHVQCGPSSGVQECYGTRFYYLNQGQSTHSCEGEESCRRSMIHAVSPVALVCKGQRSCRIASFVLPSDEQLNQQSSLTVYSEYALTTDTMKVYSLYPFTNVISADGTALDAIHFVYGMRFNQYCIVSDTSCMDAVATNIANDDELTIINTYPEGIPSQSLTYNGDVLIFATFKSTTFTPPSIPDANTLSILCLDCRSVTFQLEGLQNAVLSDTSGRLSQSSITGPSGYFELNIMHWSSDNKYLLQNTSTIAAQSFGENAEVHLGNALDVHIKCSLQSDGSLYWSCPNANIWSTLQRNELHLATATAGYWDLDTSYEFLIHFDFEEYPCTYIHYTSNCSFMTFNPTNHPSQSPTKNPSESALIQSTFTETQDRVLTESKDNEMNLEMIPWIITGIVGICVVLAIILFYKHRKNGNGGAQMVGMMAHNNHNQDVMHWNAQPKRAANVSKESIVKIERDTTELTEWLTSQVELPQYVSNFVDNGYETMIFARDIASIEDLQDIGVTLIGHQTRILAQLKKLNAEQQEKEQMVVEVEQKHGQGHMPQSLILDELEGVDDAIAPPLDDAVIDLQGGVTLGSLPKDNQLENHTA